MNQVLLVVDAQNIYFFDSSELCVQGFDDVMSNVNRLIEHYEKRGWDIVYVKHMHKDDGSDSGRMWDFAGESEEIGFVEGSPEVDYADSLKLVKNRIEIIKHRYSAFVDTDLLRILKEKSVEKIVICGFMTNFCCESTARHAHDLDFYVDFIYDATGTPDLEELNQSQIIAASCETLKVGYAVVKNTDEYIIEN